MALRVRFVDEDLSIGLPVETDLFDEKREVALGDENAFLGRGVDQGLFDRVDQRTVGVTGMGLQVVEGEGDDGEHREGHQKQWANELMKPHAGGEKGVELAFAA